METILSNIPKSAFCVRPELLEKIIFKNKEGRERIRNICLLGLCWIVTYIITLNQVHSFV